MSLEALIPVRLRLRRRDVELSRRFAASLGMTWTALLREVIGVGLSRLEAGEGLVIERTLALPAVDAAARNSAKV